jgi:hypothetical protein
MSRNPAQDLVRRLYAIYNADYSHLAGADQLGRNSQRVTSTLELAVSAAEQDARRKLRKVRQGQTAGTARVRAWVTTQGLRIAARALRRASAEAVAYRVELRQHFIIPAQEAQQGRRQPRRGGGGFDVLDGT